MPSITVVPRVDGIELTSSGKTIESTAPTAAGVIAHAMHHAIYNLHLRDNAATQFNDVGVEFVVRFTKE